MAYFDDWDFWIEEESEMEIYISGFQPFTNHDQLFFLNGSPFENKNIHYYFHYHSEPSIIAIVASR